MNRKKYVMEQGAAVPFHNRTDYCVGTGRMGLALQKEYQTARAGAGGNWFFPYQGTWSVFR